MKKIIVGIVVVFFIISGFSSCNKCYTCDFGNGDVRELCSKDFPDGNEGLKMTIDAYEEQGYKCDAK